MNKRPETIRLRWKGPDVECLTTRSLGGLHYSLASYVNANGLKLTICDEIRLSIFHTGEEPVQLSKTCFQVK